MLLKISMPGQFQFRMIQDWKSVFFHRGGDIHYIGGAEILPLQYNEYHLRGEKIHFSNPESSGTETVPASKS